MEEPKIEFSPVSSFQTVDQPDLKTQTLSHNPRTGDTTVLLTHVPGSEWGEPICNHAYWEQVYIISGRIYDKTLDKWFTADSYCCRPPGMLHGPYQADPDLGCREICFFHYSSVPRTPSSPHNRAIFFDLMGTCLNWHSSITRALQSFSSPSEANDLAFAWRAAFFRDITSRFDAGLPVEDIDSTHHRTLQDLLSTPTHGPPSDSSPIRSAIEDLVAAWHSMHAWPDVLPALTTLRSRGYRLFVLANGTTKLQLDLMSSSGLGPYFDMLFSSELLGLSKPDSRIYIKAMKLAGVKKEDSVMVAAHAYDSRAAKGKEVGMRTVYVRRETEDRDEDMWKVRTENNAFGEGMQGLVDMVEGVFGSW